MAAGRGPGQWWGPASQPGQAGCRLLWVRARPRLVCGSLPLTCARRPCHLALWPSSHLPRAQEAQHALDLSLSASFSVRLSPGQACDGGALFQGCHCFRSRSLEAQESHRNQNFLSRRHPPRGLGWRMDGRAGWRRWLPCPQVGPAALAAPSLPVGVGIS